MTKERIVHLEALSRTFEDGPSKREVLKHIDLEVASGELVALVGPSGCGKTTLLSIVGALDPDYDGTLELFGKSLASLDDNGRTSIRNEKIGFVFQAFHLLEHLDCGQNVRVPLWLQSKRLEEKEESRLVEEALERVSLGGRARESVTTLSGGERQRVAIARALVNSPELLIADEPTGNLDEATGDTIRELFDEIRSGQNGTACAVVIATHSTRFADAATRTLSLSEGRLT